jgi:hypothetical protein
MAAIVPLGLAGLQRAFSTFCRRVSTGVPPETRGSPLRAIRAVVTISRERTEHVTQRDACVERQERQLPAGRKPDASLPMSPSGGAHAQFPGGRLDLDPLFRPPIS